MNNCLVTRLNASVNDANLPELNTVSFSGAWGAYDSIKIYDGGMQSPLPYDAIYDLEGGTIDGQHHYVVPAGTTVSIYTNLTVTKDNGATKLKIRIRNKYLISGFGADAKLGEPDYTEEDLYSCVNLSYITLSVNKSFNLCRIVENMIKNSRPATSTKLAVYSYGNNTYDVYSGTPVSIQSKTVYIIINSAQTEYEIRQDTQSGTVLARKQLIDGVWTSVAI